MRTATRRRFLALLAALAALVALRPRGVVAHQLQASKPHPTPRPGITAAKVATHAQLDGDAKAIAVFDQVREIPGIVDGIGCRCGCAEYKDYHSLLSCFEAPDMMAKDCAICQTQARVVHRLHKAGRTLDEIRKGVDARFG